jgi:hypothetical protein
VTVGEIIQLVRLIKTRSFESSKEDAALTCNRISEGQRCQVFLRRRCWCGTLGALEFQPDKVYTRNKPSDRKLARKIEQLRGVIVSSASASAESGWY